MGRGEIHFIEERPWSMTKVSEKTKKYDAAYKEVFDFYKSAGSALSSSSDFVLFNKSGEVANPVPHLFRCYSLRNPIPEPSR